MSFYINKKSINIENDKKRENNERQNQRDVASKTKGIRSSDARRAVTQKETSVKIRSSGLVHSEVLQDTLEGKEIEVLGGIQTVSQKSEVLYCAKIVSEHQKFSALSVCGKSEIVSVKTASGSIRSSVCLTCRENSSSVLC